MHRIALGCRRFPADLIIPALLVALLVSAHFPTAFAQPKFPELTGRVVDQANVLDDADEAVLTAELAALEEKSTDQLVIVTLRSLQGYPIEDFGYRLGRHWAIGQKGKDNGVLLIVAPKERKVRIEVGRGLEGDLTDALSKIIIENAVLPRFRASDFVGGIKAATRDIKDVILGDAEAVKKRAAGRRRGKDFMSSAELIHLLVWFAIFLFIVYEFYRSTRRGPPGPPGAASKGKEKDSGWGIVPGGYGGSGGWSGGGGGSGGGGFGGGGGGFGGGGASGGW